MVTLSKMIILWYLFTASQLPFDFNAPNLMTEQKGKGYQGIRAIEALEYENTRSNFKCCDYREK